MTTKPFTASNGDTIETRPDGWLVVRDALHTEWVSPLMVDTLREYFQHRRDTELGRWRDPEAPDMVVYRVPENDDKDGRAVRVIDEATGTYASLWERDVKHFERGSMHATAARYFAAHPEPEPEWHDAQPGEVWLLTIDGAEEPATVGYSITPGVRKFYVGSDTFDLTDTGITAGRKLWPEVDDE